MGEEAEKSKKNEELPSEQIDNTSKKRSIEAADMIDATTSKKKGVDRDATDNREQKKGTSNQPPLIAGKGANTAVDDFDDVSDSSDDIYDSQFPMVAEGDGKETLNVKYWDAHFAIDAEYDTQTEYLMSYVAIRPLIDEYLSEDKKEKILIPGCGNCNFSAMLYDGGWENLVSTDISPVAINNMKALSEVEGRTKMVWEVDDAMDMQYDDETFDLMIDKSLLDCMYHVRESRYLPSIEHFLHECCRTTKVGGRCIFITQRSFPETARFFGVEDMDKEDCTGKSIEGVGLPLPWTVLARMCVVEREPLLDVVHIDAEGYFMTSDTADALLNQGRGKVFFMYVCEKTEKYDVEKITADGWVFPSPSSSEQEEESVHDPRSHIMMCPHEMLETDDEDNEYDEDDNVADQSSEEEIEGGGKKKIDEPAVEKLESSENEK